MSDRVNRRDVILETAARLFEAQGYQATSTRQIAEAVGCTEAALYYHFKDGKRELLQTVIETQVPEVITMFDQCREAHTLKQTMVCFGESATLRSAKMRWILVELPHLGPEERAATLAKFQTLQESLAQVFRRFVEDEALAAHLAWLIVCVGVGYEQIFWDPVFSARVDLNPEDLVRALVDVMA
jgi:AcrR family transcriptional regulator